MTIDPANVFFSIPLRKDYKHLTFIWTGKNTHFSLARTVLAPHFCHIIAERDLDIPQNQTVVHYINDMVLLKPEEEEKASPWRSW